MYNEVDPDEFTALQNRVNALATELSVHKALVIALMSELGTEALTEFSNFRTITHEELSKQPIQSDAAFNFKRLLNEYLNRALYESQKEPLL